MVESEIIKWVISFLCGSVVSVCGMLLTMFKTKRKRQTALENGVQCLLRLELIRSYDKYTERGHVPIYAREALDRAYKSYHSLGGNDVATNLYNKIMALPTEPKEGG